MAKTANPGKGAIAAGGVLSRSHSCGVLDESGRADPPSLSPVRAFICDSNSIEGFSVKTF